MSHNPIVMTIVNVTPDSFFEGSRTVTPHSIEQRIVQAVAHGAQMIDIGGYSTRPNGCEVSPEQELQRVVLGVEALRRVAPEMPFSVDTFRSSVVRSVAQVFGSFTVNDISAGAIDPAIIDVAAEHGLPYILMHSAVKSPTDLHPKVDYGGDVVGVVRDFLLAKAEQIGRRGVKEILIDPGFGFSKSIEENFALLKGLGQITSLDYKTLVGVSRKSFIFRTLGLTPTQIESHTAAIHWQALLGGAAIVRTHDTELTKQIVTLYQKYDRA